jgi:DNA-binding beta-propeller fold protein YncE
MRNRFLITILAAVLSAAAAGASYVQVVSSFVATYSVGPTTWYAYSVEYDGTYVWTAVLYHLVKRTYPAGSILGTFRMDPYSPYGMAYDGRYIYSTNAATTRYVYKVDPATGSTVTSFGYPSGATRGAGLAYDGSRLYFSCYDTSRVWRLTTTGSVLATLPTAITKPWGLAYDDKTPGGPFLWLADHPFGSGPQSKIYKLTTAGSIIDSANWPVAGVGACGLAFDGTYLWGINNVFPQPNLALRMLFVSDIGVAPASVGRIKALYR